MLEEVLKLLSPDALVYAIKNNPVAVQGALHKFEAYKVFGEALTKDQQVFISSNLDKIADFFKTEKGMDAISILADEFIKFKHK